MGAMLAGCLPQPVAQAAVPEATDTGVVPTDTPVPTATEFPTEVPMNTEVWGPPTSEPTATSTQLSTEVPPTPAPTEKPPLVPVEVNLTGTEGNLTFHFHVGTRLPIPDYIKYRNEVEDADLWWGAFCTFYLEPLYVSGVPEIKTHRDMYMFHTIAGTTWGKDLADPLYGKCDPDISPDYHDWKEQITVILN